MVQSGRKKKSWIQRHVSVICRIQENLIFPRDLQSSCIFAYLHSLSWDVTRWHPKLLRAENCLTQMGYYVCWYQRQQTVKGETSATHDSFHFIPWSTSCSKNAPSGRRVSEHVEHVLKGIFLILRPLFLSHI